MISHVTLYHPKDASVSRGSEKMMVSFSMIGI